MQLGDRMNGTGAFGCQKDMINFGMSLLIGTILKPRFPLSRPFHLDTQEKFLQRFACLNKTGFGYMNYIGKSEVYRGINYFSYFSSKT